MSVHQKVQFTKPCYFNCMNYMNPFIAGSKPLKRLKTINIEGFSCFYIDKLEILYRQLCIQPTKLNLGWQRDKTRILWLHFESILSHGKQ